MLQADLYNKQGCCLAPGQTLVTLFQEQFLYLCFENLYPGKSNSTHLFKIKKQWFKKKIKFQMLLTTAQCESCQRSVPVWTAQSVSLIV